MRLPDRFGAETDSGEDNAVDDEAPEAAGKSKEIDAAEVENGNKNNADCVAPECALL